MNKIIVSLLVTLLIAVAVLFYKVYSATEPEKFVYDNTGKPSSKLSSDDIIVYYNQDTVVVKSLYIDSLKKTMEKNYKNSQAQYETKTNAYKAWVMQQEELARKGLLSQAEMEKAQSEDMSRQQTLMMENERLTNSLNDRENEFKKLAHQAILKSTKELNKKRKIKFVLAYSEMLNNVIPMESAVDVTSEMVEIINGLYKPGEK